MRPLQGRALFAGLPGALPRAILFHAFSVKSSRRVLVLLPSWWKTLPLFTNGLMPHAECWPGLANEPITPG
jgi:hypothetical protein